MLFVSTVFGLWSDKKPLQSSRLVMAKQLTDHELRQQAVRALSDGLGPVDALRFLALVSREPFDYQEWRREYFSRFNVDELSEAVLKHHASKNS